MHPPVRPPPSGHRFLRPALVGRRRVAWRASCCGLPTWLRGCLRCLLLSILSILPILPFLPISHAAAASEFGFAEPYFEPVESVKSPSTVITALAQDAQGWLWIGTGEGLFRYDGYRLRKFVHEEGNPASLVGNFVTALWPAADGRLWIGSQTDGLSIFDPHSEKFTRLQHNPSRPDTLPAGRIWALQGDAAGGIWIGCNDGLVYAQPGTLALRHFKHQANQPHSLIDNRIRSLLLDRRGTLWVGTVVGLQRHQPGSAGQPRFFRVASDPAQTDSLAGQNIQALFQAQDGKLWIGTHKQGAAWLMPDANPTNPTVLHWLRPDPQNPQGLSHGWVDAIIEAEPGQIWLATAGGGINIVSGKDGTLLGKMRHHPALASSLTHDSVKQILRDHSGLLWIATWGGGLQRYHPAQRAFRVVRHNPTDPRGLSHPDIRSVLELADRRILVGSGGNGIDILDRQHGQIGGWRPEPARPGGLPDGNVLSMLEQADGTLWIGSLQAGVVRLAKGSVQWQAFGTAQGLPSPLVRRLLQTRDGTLWAATGNGLASWQAEQQRFVVAQQKGDKPVQADILALTEDRQGRLWAASDNGLWHKAPGAQHWQVILHQPGQAGSLSGNNTHGLLVDTRGQLWVTSTKGLDRLDRFDRRPGLDGEQAVFEHVGRKIGRPAEEVGSDLWQDRQGRIWSGAAEQMLDPVSLKQGRNGLPDIGAVWIGAFGSSHDGLLMYGGAQGLSIFNPAQFVPWNFQAPVRVTELKIDGQAVAPGDIGRGLQLEAEQRNFSIEFSALDFFKPSQIRYRYRLQGYDRNWISTDPEHRLASYGNLWPGRYVLQIQASNSVGTWSPQPLSIPVQVLPALWQTGWFMVLVGLGLLGSMRALYRWRVTRIKAQHHEQAEQLRAMVEQRTAEIVTTHNALAAAHSDLSDSHRQLASAHQSLQQTQQQLILQEKMAGLGTLTAGIAHEINNPLNFTHVAAQIQHNQLEQFEQYVNSLFDSETDPRITDAFAQHFASLSENLALMQHGTERIKAIVQDLRSFTRLDEAEKKTVHLSECLSATVNLVRTRWPEQVEFIIDAGDDPPYECWPALLNQVFMNLVLNAGQAIVAKQQQCQQHSKGHVWLRLRGQPDCVTIHIEDDGIGIAPELQKRILEPFFTTREVGSGIGMGLSISYGIIQKHGGTLSISSTPGLGSCFAIRLPLTSKGETGASEP